MGCCEMNCPDAHLTPITLHPSILVKSKRHSTSIKKVRFDLSYTGYQDLHITEEDMPEWCKSALVSDLSLCDLVESELFRIYFTHDGESLSVIPIISFGFNIDPHSLVCLINNPKYRILWDQDLEKMKVIFGDCNLDALVEISENKNCRLFERKVRVSGDVLYCFYIPHKDESGNTYFFAAIPVKNTVRFCFRDQVKKDEISKYIEKTQVWTARLIREILIHRDS